jgi:nitroreductase
MNEALQLLLNRNSAPRLCEPGPSIGELKEMVRAATRVPDHAWLRPWRFLAIQGERRAALGSVLQSALIARNPDADSRAREKAEKSPFRAPLVLVVITQMSEHPKVPLVEQRMSAACAAHAILLAAQALDYAGVWRTGDAAFDRSVMTELGLAENEELTGFLYLGTREGPSKPIPTLDPDDFLSQW